jgi:hypothetical protein
VALRSDVSGTNDDGNRAYGMTLLISDPPTPSFFRALEIVLMGMNLVVSDPRNLPSSERP